MTMDHSLPAVAFIGLGVMGYPMAGHLQQAGYQVQVYNRTHAKAVAWQQQYQQDWRLQLQKAIRQEGGYHCRAECH